MRHAVIDLVDLDAVAPEQIIALHTHPEVLRHLPLAPAQFGMTECLAWIESKRVQWSEHGFGPWAVLIDGDFAGWGGFQREGNDADLALVMFPAFWGHGAAVCRRMLRSGLPGLGRYHITALLPVSRTRTRGMARLGFDPAGERSIDGQRFMRFVMRPASRQR